MLISRSGGASVRESRARILGGLAGGLVFVAFATGCCDYSTEIQVKDPAQVELHAGMISGDTQVVLPAGNEAATVAYPVPEIAASREPNGALRLSCGTCDFDSVTLVESSGAFRPIAVAPEFSISRTARSREELRAKQKLEAYRGRDGDGAQAYREDRSIMPVLKTPWTNVREVREKATPVRFLAVLHGVPGLILTGAGVWLMSRSWVAGTAMLIPGVGFDVSAVYHAVAASKTSTVYSESSAPVAGNAP